jgi:hypothetical protein
VEFRVDGDAVRLTRAEDGGGRGRAIVERLRGRSTAGLSTHEILARSRE